jgi:hypothetical protein
MDRDLLRFVVLAAVAAGVWGLGVRLKHSRSCEPTGAEAPRSSPRRAQRGPRQLARPELRYAHTVKRGQSLSSIGSSAGVPVGDLVELNRLRRGGEVRAGRKLRLRPLTARAGGRDLLSGLKAGDVTLVVRKRRRLLECWVRGRLFKRYRIGLGWDPAEDKCVEGDGRTPLGDFYVCQLLPEGKFGPSLGLSYPDLEDADRGLRGRLITRAQHRSIVKAISEKRRPPWGTPLGGAICIHGRGSASDWTAGCVALDDADAGELFALTPAGARVRVLAER